MLDFRPWFSLPVGPLDLTLLALEVSLTDSDASNITSITGEP